MEINIIERDFNFIGRIDNFESYMPNKKYDGIGSFELHLPSNALYADELTKERIIFTSEDKAYIILYRKRDTGTNKMVVRGQEIKSYLSRMLVFPPEGQSSYRINDNAETIMKEYVVSTLARKNITNVEVAANQNRGDKFAYQSRYKNLANELQKIGKASGLGWDIHLDMDKKKFVFDVVEGRDITVNQTDRPPAIFSVDYDNIQSQVLEESRLDYANTAIVAGQGEGANRAIYISGDTEGLDSIETFVDARDLENDADLPDRAMQKLKETEEKLVFDSEVLTDKNLIYEEDFRLGDIGTVQNKEWDISVNRRITEFTEIYEASGFRLDLVFGENMPDLIDKVKMITDAPVAENREIEGEQGPTGERGPKGDTGPSGPKGDKGEQGVPGERGPRGFQGEKGDIGSQGPKGAQGIQGEVGPQGKQGPKGNDGYTPIKGIDYSDGQQGPKGEKGDLGPRGIQGVQGEIGPMGKTGAQGPAGKTGPKGDAGPKGEKPNHRWVSKTQIQFERPDGTWGEVIDLNPDTISIHQERYTTTANQEVFQLTKGAYRLNTNSISWYLDGIKQSNEAIEELSPSSIKIKGGVPTESTVLIEYLEFANVAIGLKGDRGPQGIQGLKGDKGDKGEKGDKGDTGPRGIQGAKGEKGDTGSQGSIGATGPKGDKGEAGYTPIKGVDYFDGAKGEKGDQGIQGIKGDTGPRGLQGLKGDTGIQGPKGDPFVYSDFTSTQLANLKGPKGDKGDTGPRGPQGIQGPQGAAVADSVEWSKVLNKPGSYPPSAHTHTSLRVADTRAVDDKPSEIPSRTLSTAFKQNTSVANPPVTTGSSYAHIVTMNGWTGAGAGGGGETTQIAFGDSLAIRMSAGTNSWGPWKRLAYDVDVQKTVTSSTEPSLRAGDQWHKEI